MQITVPVKCTYFVGFRVPSSGVSAKDFARQMQAPRHLTRALEGMRPPKWGVLGGSYRGVVIIPL